MPNDYETAAADRRNSKRRIRRTQTVSTKLTGTEEAELRQISSSEGKSLGEWVRDVLLRSIRSTLTISDQESILLTEIVGIQLLLMNLLSPLSRGEHITREQYQEIIKNVQSLKSRTTRELLAKRVCTVE